MDRLEQLERALRNAHKAGDTNAARMLAREIQRMRGADQQPAVASEPEPQVTHTTPDGGRFLRGPDGGTSFASPGFSTTDPATVQRLMQGATPAESMRADIQDEALARHPVAARGAAAIRGVPFLGEYADEAAGAMFGPQARDGVRLLQGAMDDRRPGEALGLGVAGGIAGSVPLALAGAPAVMSAAPAAIGAQMGYGAGVGMGLGAVEGAVSGFGRGTEGDRLRSSGEGAVMGGVAGGVVGGAVPAAGATVRNLVGRFRGSDVAVIADELGVSREAARVIKNALDAGDIAQAEAAIRRAGPGAMLADAGEPARVLLDASMATAGGASRIAREAIEGRASDASQAFSRVLDRTLGRPEGVETVRRSIREGTAGARSAAYDAAYAQPIDYSAAQGLALEGLIPRVPPAVWRRANELMRLDGDESAQILIRVGDGGRVSLERLPDVRQWDYVARALGDMADTRGAGAMGGQTSLGRSATGLQRSIRANLRSAVPEYARALDTAADAISRSKGAQLGYEMLRRGTTREAVRDGLAGQPRAVREEIKRGLRAFIDDEMARVSRVVSDPNIDARELRSIVSGAANLTSRANREKVELLLGPRQAAAFFRDFDEAVMALELRAAVAANSRTAVRQGVQADVRMQTEPGTLAMLAQGQPVQATRRMVQVMTGQTPEAQALREQGIYQEIAQALTGIRNHNAARAIQAIERAMAGQPMREVEAQMIARLLIGSMGSGAYQSTSRSHTR